MHMACFQKAIFLKKIIAQSFLVKYYASSTLRYQINFLFQETIICNGYFLL